MTDKLKDKIAIVTGSDSGIGQATAKAFAEEGADVTITYFHDEKGAEETRRQVEAAGPGMVLTPMNQPAMENRKVYEKQVESIPWKRAAEPWEIAHLAVYLASEDADYASGQTFTLDGGLTMNTGQGA